MLATREYCLANLSTAVTVSSCAEETSRGIIPSLHLPAVKSEYTTEHNKQPPLFSLAERSHRILIYHLQENPPPVMVQQVHQIVNDIQVSLQERAPHSREKMNTASVPLSSGWTEQDLLTKQAPHQIDTHWLARNRVIHHALDTAFSIL